MQINVSDQPWQPNSYDFKSNVCMYEVESNSFENKQGIIPDQIRSDQSIYKSPSESPDIFTRQQ
jgi:hypothetical protein